MLVKEKKKIHANDRLRPEDVLDALWPGGGGQGKESRPRRRWKKKKKGVAREERRKHTPDRPIGERYTSSIELS